MHIGYSSKIIAVIFCVVQHIKCKQFFAGVMRLPSNCIIFIVDYPVAAKTFVVHNRTKNCVSNCINIIGTVLNPDCFYPELRFFPCTIKPILCAAIVFKFYFVVIPNVPSAIGNAPCTAIIKTYYNTGGSGKSCTIRIKGWGA